MKKTILIIAGLVISFCFGFYFRTIVPKQTENKITLEQAVHSVNLKKVTGVAGIFFKCKDPKKIKEWYKTHLGFDTNQYGTNFEWLEGTDPIRKGSLQWSPFSETTRYFAPSTKDFMINYRVENLVSLAEQLKKEGVTFVDSIETYEYGKFVHIMDIEGNKIELYEPNDGYVETDKEKGK
jgi:predicted enzyme related to lactoylglutathione lyase